MIKTLLRGMEQGVLDLINIDRYLPIQIDITNACNLRCSHCYHPHHQNEGAIDFSDWINLLDQYEALITRLGFRPYVIICGGEPFLSNHFEPILQNILKRNRSYKISILTNGTIVDHGKLGLLKEFKDISIQVSIDGPNHATHDAVRGTGSFHRSLRGIGQFQERGIKVDLLAVLSKRSAPAIGEFFDLAQSLSVVGMGFTRLIATGHAEKLVAEHEDRPLDPLELRETYRSILQESARTGVKTGTSAPLFHLVFSGLGRNGRFGEGIVIDYKGNYLATSRSRLVLGNALKEGMENILLNHPLLRRLRRGDIQGCGTCPHLTVCGGDRNAAFAHSQDFLGVDPGCWLPITKTKTA